MTCCPPGQLLPISTGRIGFSQTSGQVEWYGHNWRGTGIGLFRGNTCWFPPCPPWWGASTACCSACGCSPCSCCGPDNTKCFTQLLTNIGPWCCFWQDQQYSAWLTGKQPWPTTAEAANTTLQNSLPAACFPVLPVPPYPAPTNAATAAVASIGVH